MKKMELGESCEQKKVNDASSSAFLENRLARIWPTTAAELLLSFLVGSTRPPHMLSC